MRSFLKVLLKLVRLYLKTINKSHTTKPRETSATLLSNFHLKNKNELDIKKQIKLDVVFIRNKIHSVWT